jgi:hypothetical protein
VAKHTQHEQAADEQMTPTNPDGSAMTNGAQNQEGPKVCYLEPMSSGRTAKIPSRIYSLQFKDENGQNFSVPKSYLHKSGKDEAVDENDYTFIKFRNVPMLDQSAGTSREALHAAIDQWMDKLVEFDGADELAWQSKPEKTAKRTVTLLTDGTKEERPLTVEQLVYQMLREKWTLHNQAVMQNKLRPLAEQIAREQLNIAPPSRKVRQAKVVVQPEMVEDEDIEQ